MSAVQQKTFSAFVSCYVCGHARKTENGGNKIVGLDGRTVERTDKLVRCSRCHIATYCSVACQQKDWRVHKKHCRVSDAPFDTQIVERKVKHFFKIQYEGEDVVDLDFCLRQSYLIFFLSSKENEITWRANGEPIVSYEAWQGQPIVEEGIYKLEKGIPFQRPCPLFKQDKSSKYSMQLGHFIEFYQTRLVVQVELRKQLLGPDKNTWTTPVGNFIFSVGQFV